MRKEKTLLLDAVADTVGQAKSLILTSYDKMSANKAADFRTALRETGSQYAVVKKSIFLKAAEAQGFKFENELQGHIGIVCVTENTIDAAKALYKFMKENENMVKVLGGQFEGKICSPQEFEMISKLPTQDEMRAQLLATFEAPMSHTLSVIEEMLKTMTGAVVESEA